MCTKKQRIFVLKTYFESKSFGYVYRERFGNENLGCHPNLPFGEMLTNT